MLWLTEYAWIFQNNALSIFNPFVQQKVSMDNMTTKSTAVYVLLTICFPRDILFELWFIGYL